MDNPVNDIRRVVSELCEPDDAREMVAAVDKYFTDDARFICAFPHHGLLLACARRERRVQHSLTGNSADPLLNSPKGSGKEGVKAAYKMLRGGSSLLSALLRSLRSSRLC